MRLKKLLIFSLMSFAAVASAAAQDFDENKPRTITTEVAEKKPTCTDFAFGAGCMGFSLGPAFTSVNSSLLWGGYGIFSYFLIDRLALQAGGGAMFSSAVNNYYLGPALTYYIGPFSGYLFKISYGADRHFFRGDLQADGWSYGPSIGLMTQLVGRIYWGISISYVTFAIDDYRQSDWQWSPVVFIPF
jgi:hypothetical protein